MIDPRPPRRPRPPPRRPPERAARARILPPPGLLLYRAGLAAVALAALALPVAALLR